MKGKKSVAERSLFIQKILDSSPCSGRLFFKSVTMAERISVTHFQNIAKSNLIYISTSEVNYFELGSEVYRINYFWCFSWSNSKINFYLE